MFLVRYVITVFVTMVMGRVLWKRFRSVCRIEDSLIRLRFHRYAVKSILSGFI